MQVTLESLDIDRLTVDQQLSLVTDLWNHILKKKSPSLLTDAQRDELAADVFQNAFLAIFAKAKQYEPGRPARPWIYAIATHAAIDAQRREKRQRVQPADPLPNGDGEPRTVLDLVAGEEPNPGEWA